MTPEDLKDLYIQQLRDLYSAENQLLDELPVMSGRAQNDELQDVLWQHVEETRWHISRLEGIFEALDVSPNGQKCHAIKGIVREANDLMANANRIFGKNAPAEVLDAGLLAIAQRAEHYEISGYGTVATYAKTLGREDDLELLMQTLKEEKKADERLTRIAKELVNPAAKEPETSSKKEEVSSE